VTIQTIHITQSAGDGCNDVIIIVTSHRATNWTIS